MIKQDEQLVRLAAHTLIGKNINLQAVTEVLAWLARYKNKIFLKELDYLLTAEGDIGDHIRRYIEKYKNEQNN